MRWPFLPPTSPLRRLPRVPLLSPLRTLRMQLRFLVPLVAVLTAAAYLSLPVMDRVTLRWFARDLHLRGALVATTLSESVTSALVEERPQRLRTLFNRTMQDERLVGLALCTPAGRLAVASTGFPEDLNCEGAREAARQPEPELRIAGGPVHVGTYPVSGDDGPVADIVLLQDLSFVERRSADTRRYLLALIVGTGIVIALITMVVAQISWRGWVTGARALLRGEGLIRPLDGSNGRANGRGGMPELAPLAAELRTRLRDLEDEFRRSLGPQAEWNPERLRSLLHTQLRGDEVIVVSNREPYIHQRGPEGGVEVMRPASGLVTAVEPVMRACSGTWIAHGSGSADRETVDGRDHVRVPPENGATRPPPGSAKPDPVGRYTLRRIWLTPEEEQGYYSGFANEGLWPLCHVAHVRPVFRATDWETYRAVNQRFADAVVAEAHSEDPVVLVQDYHFALLPAMVRAKLPRATILTFWHIPWPNPESFGICPWRRELLEGMLGSTILGFHTRYHCKNFLETVDRYLEARIQHEVSNVRYRGEDTLIESYPISIEWPDAATVAARAPVDESRLRVRERLGLAPDLKIALGVDRFDYTKGIFERINAVERLFEKHPAWIGRFTFVQIAAPSRSMLPEYRLFRERINEQVSRVNQRFQRDGWLPVRLIAEHHDAEAVTELYRAAEVCVVTSLHDGMNLVSKEYVAARDDEQGVLILSRFAGAANELNEALIVNPYHVEETADALHEALSMPPAEQRERMASLRMTVREANVFRWAGRMLADAARWRLRRRIEDRVARSRGGEDE